MAENRLLPKLELRALRKWTGYSARVICHAIMFLCVLGIFVELSGKSIYEDPAGFLDISETQARPQFTSQETLHLVALMEKLRYSHSGISRNTRISDRDSTPIAGRTSIDMTRVPQAKQPTLEEPIRQGRSKLHRKPQPQLVTWKCSCGSSLSDYYTEIIPGSVQRLQEQLLEEALPCSSRYKLQLSNPAAWITSKFTASSISPQQMIDAKPGTPQSTSSSADGVRPQSRTLSYNPGDLTQTSPQPVSSPGNRNPQEQTPASLVHYPLLCFPERLCGLRLYHQQLLQSPGSAQLPNYVVNDNQLFHLLRRKYSAERSTGFSRFWPKTVIRVSLAHFLVDSSDLVDLRHFACLGAAAYCKCIPPANDNSYHCTPRPSPYTPPIGSNYLTHLFQHPECIKSGNTRILNQIPKRLGQCIATSGAEAIEGWGIEFEEGWDRGRLRNAAFLVVVAGTLLFAVLWAVLKHDIQSAFTVSAFFVSIVAIVGTYVASTEPRFVHN